MGNNLRRDFAAAQRRRGVMGSSVAKRDGQLALFEQWLKPRGLLAATPDDVEGFLDSRRGRGGGPLADRSRYGWISHLHAFYTWAQRAGMASTDPTVTIDRPRLRQNLPRPISEQDLEVVMTAAAGDHVLVAWLTLMAWAGLRCAEVAGLAREDVLDHEALLRVLGKGQKERLVPMHPSIYGRLRSAGMPRTGPVFARPDGRPWTAGEVSRITNRHISRAGVDATPHQLRHRFGTRTYAACRDIRVVAELMGHSSILTTQGYVAWSRTEARAAVVALPLTGDPAAPAALAG